MKVNFSLAHPGVVFIGSTHCASLGRGVLPGNTLQQRESRRETTSHPTSPGRWLGLLLQNSISHSTAKVALCGNLGSILRILDWKLKSQMGFFSSSTLFSNCLDKIQRGGDSRSKEQVLLGGTTPCKQELPWATVVAEVKPQLEHLGKAQSSVRATWMGTIAMDRAEPGQRDSPAGRGDSGTFILPRQGQGWSSPWG